MLERMKNIPKLTYIYAAIMFVATVLLNFPLKVGGLELQLPAMVLISLTFLCTDIEHEVNGEKAAHRMAVAGIVANGVFYLALKLIVPSLSLRAVLGSVFTMIISQLLDVKLFTAWRDKFPALKWVRNNGSTMISQFVDTVIFMTILYAGTSWTQWLYAIGSVYLIKFICAFADTPLFYWLTNEKMSAWFAHK